jgi:hypothetical protein
MFVFQKLVVLFHYRPTKTMRFFASLRMTGTFESLTIVWGWVGGLGAAKQPKPPHVSAVFLQRLFQKSIVRNIFFL